MTMIISTWVALTVLLGVSSTIAVWSRKQTRARSLSVLTFIGGSPIAAIALVICLGWPLPLVSGITGPSGDFTVLGSKLVANEAIYVLVDVGDAPRYFVIPWDKDAAKKIQDAIDNQSGLRMTIPPMEYSWERREPLSFHEIPQPKVLPEKPREEKPATRLDSI